MSTDATLPRCRACARLNPPEARFCHHDGAALAGLRDSGPVAVGTRPFLTPFVFPSGRACGSFDELVLACEQDWEAARDMVGQGFFEGFLGALGRADLAVAARLARREPDPDRALDQLLSRLPGHREPPVVSAQPAVVSLGQTRVGEERRFVLRLANRGMGLLTGSVAADVPWLAVGDAPGAPRKLFQCRHEMELPVQVHGKALRAGPKPLKGQLLIESSGGALAVPVQVEVPPRPFPEGALAGALTPRQLAEKARDNAREAALLFEKGAAAAWYQSNGWDYPVQGPAASGMAAVQQFFEALGLAQAPKVVVSQQQLDLHGAPGGNVEAFVFVETAEKRHVYAHAVSEAPWLQVGKVRHDGRTARIHLRVPNVPATPGERLEGKVQITANGNQRFTVRVSLSVSGRLVAPAFEPAPATVKMQAQAGGRPGVPLSRDTMAGPPPPPPPAPVLEVAEPRGGRARVVALESPVPRPVEEPRYREPPAATLEPARDLDPEPPRRRNPLRHLTLLGVLLAALGGVLVHDLLLPARPPGDDADVEEPLVIDPNPLVSLRFHDGPNPDMFGIAEGVMSFGLHGRDPAEPGQTKKLMWDALGRTNNVCVRVDDRDFLFGHANILFPRPGERALKIDGVARWVERKVPLGRDEKLKIDRDGARSVWLIEGLHGQRARELGLTEKRARVQVTQTAEVVANPQSGKLDTCLVRYTIENKDDRLHSVGLRFLLDTFIGANDGVPFTIPGRAGLCSTLQRFDRPEDVPDYIQALEHEDLLKPGTVAHLQFRLAQHRLEPPSRVLLGGYPDAPLQQLGHRLANGWYTPWDVPAVPIREMVDKRAQLRDLPRDPVPDSAVTLWWDVRPLAPGAKREVGFSYGLGQVASAEGEGKLLLTVGGRTVRGGEFSLTALRHQPQPGEKLTLTLPAGERFELLSPAEQEVPPVAAGADRPISTVTWRLRALRVGRSTLSVQSSAGVRQKQPIHISPPPRGVLD